jgi:hypothetical protein
VRSVAAVVGQKQEDAKQYGIGRLRFTFGERRDFVNADVQNGCQSFLITAKFYGPLHQVAMSARGYLTAKPLLLVIEKNFYNARVNVNR